MKTLLIATSTFPRWQGDAVAARFVFDLSRELTKYYRVIVLAPHDPGAKQHEWMEGVEVRRFPYFFPKKYERLCNGAGILPNLRSGFFPKVQVPSLFVAEAYWLARLIEKERVDVVNSHWMIPQGFTVALVKQFVDVPHLVTIHSSDLHTLKRFFFGRWVSQFILRSADCIITVSNYLKTVLDKLVGYSTTATVLPMGVDLKRFTTHKTQSLLRHEYQISAEKVILYVGKLIEVKGVHVLIHAMNILTKQRKDIQLILVGDGILREKLEVQVDNLNLNPFVRFTGAVGHKQLADFYTLCDLVVVPSLITPRGETEGMPVVILEAMSVGKPVVGSNVGGISDVIKNGYNGFLTSPQNPEDIAEKILMCLEESNLSRFGVRARKTAQRYGWQAIGENYQRVIDSMSS